MTLTSDSPGWKTVWIRGDVNRDYMWADWVNEVLAYSRTLPVPATHLSASSPTFKSDKYLSLKHANRRLLRALEDKEEFDHLGFISVPANFHTMAGDQLFGLSMVRKNLKVDVAGSFQNELFTTDNVKRFENLARIFFSAGRLEVFWVDKGELPSNYYWRFGRGETYFPPGFKQLKVELF
jgi:hypothetical protein